MPTLSISGIDLNFPFEPYKCQVDYMKCVLDSIIQRKNAILESPTGTGKTLCLLVSSISWLLAAKADMQFAVYQNEINDANPGEQDQNIDPKSKYINKSGALDSQSEGANKGSVYPKIIYAARTHSQLSQVIKELKMTQYNNTVKTCAIGSRDQLCINPQIMTQKNYTTKMNMCKAKVNTKTCFFHNNIENNLAEMKSMVTIDIEDLISFGNKHKCCPYYTARNLKDGADVLFMPYNYLLDKKLRKSNNIDLTNSIVIFDEAHNVERVCEDSASAEISVTEIGSAMSELGYILEEMKNMPDVDENDENGLCSDPFRDEAYSGRGGDQYGHDKPNIDVGGNMPATIDELKELLVALKALETELDNIKIDQEGLTKPAAYVFEILEKCGITMNNKGHFFDIFQRILQYFGAQPSNPRHHNGASLAKFSDFLQTVFIENQIMSEDLPAAIKKKMGKISNCYKVHIKSDNIRGRILCYWCLSPGYSMQDLLAEGARCIILTSGTLSPISTFKEDMKIPFDIVLENPHIIVESQIKVMAMSHGPNNVVLSSKYSNRDSETYLRSLGQILELTTEYWKKNNQWKEIGDAKMIFIESKGAKECADTVSKYYERIKDKRSNGALMFAVCRGKISEGIDFADDNGRAVIVTGLPFPLITDPRVKLKRQYLDENKTSSGQLWYNQQTYRAVNQAIGRVIRHKNDYGAILLCDERFTQQASISQLPGWMKKHVQKINDPTTCDSQLRKFFNLAIENYPLPVAKIPSLKANSTYLMNRDSNCGQNKLESGINLVESLASSYSGSSACCSNQSEGGSSNFYDALNSSTKAPCANQPDFFIPDLNSCSQKTQDGYKMILEKRRQEEASRNPNTRCRVVVKDTLKVGEAKPESVSNSKEMLKKITSILDAEKFKLFKTALGSFSEARKSGDNEKKIKYYKILRSLFEFDLVFFREIERFIQFTPNIKTMGGPINNETKKLVLKRKIDQCDND